MLIICSLVAPSGVSWSIRRGELYGPSDLAMERSSERQQSTRKLPMYNKSRAVAWPYPVTRKFLRVLGKDDYAEVWCGSEKDWEHKYDWEYESSSLALYKLVTKVLKFPPCIWVTIQCERNTCPLEQPADSLLWGPLIKLTNNVSKVWTHFNLRIPSRLKATGETRTFDLLPERRLEGQELECSWKITTVSEEH